MFFPLFLTLFGCINIFRFYSNFSSFIAKNKMKKHNCKGLLYQICMEPDCTAVLRETVLCLCANSKHRWFCLLMPVSSSKQSSLFAKRCFFHFQKRHQTDRESFISQRFFPFQHLVDFNANYHNQRIDAIFFSLSSISVCLYCVCFFFILIISLFLYRSLYLYLSADLHLQCWIWINKRAKK